MWIRAQLHETISRPHKNQKASSRVRSRVIWMHTRTTSRTRLVLRDSRLQVILRAMHLGYSIDIVSSPTLLRPRRSSTKKTIGLEAADSIQKLTKPMIRSEQV